MVCSSVVFSIQVFFSSFSCLGIYDITGCNRQDKTIHHAGLMWESKFNLVSLIYKYWPFWEHTEHIYLSAKSRLYTLSNKFLRPGVREKGLSVVQVMQTSGSTTGGGSKRLCVLQLPKILLLGQHFNDSTFYLSIYICSNT